MKVVHINKLSDGGAAWCAIRLSEALQKEGVCSSMLIMQSDEENKWTIPQKDFIYRSHNNLLIRLLMKIVKLIVRPRFEYYKYKRHRAEKQGNAFFTSPLTEYTSLVNHPLIREADIIHLHWIADFVDLPSFFKNIKKPVVWTIHDENPGLGGFHYISAMKNANGKYLKLNKKFALIKKKAINSWNKPHLVAISKDMKDFFKSNEILKRCFVKLIHNGVEENVFRLLDKNKCRNEFKIPMEKKVFLFSSYAIEDKRKGLTLLIKALESIHNDNILLICIGGYKEIPKGNIDIYCTGLTSDKDLLSKYYSAADYFVLSSFQEGFAQTPLEAMSCGTPVIAFPCSGIPELINDKNGVICKEFTVKALIDGISEAMKKEFVREKIREDVHSRFSYNTIAMQYINLYNDILKKALA